jgi:hypothetical protein
MTKRNTPPAAKKLPYDKPRLKKYGTLREITAGSRFANSVADGGGPGSTKSNRSGN